MIKPYTPEWVALSRQVGDALRSPDRPLVLSSGSLTGEKMYWRDAGSGTLLALNTDCWLRWIDSVVPAHSPADFPDEILTALAAWTLEPVASLLKASAFQLCKTEDERVTHQAGVTGLMLTISQGELSLPILLLEANWATLQHNVQSWRPVTMPSVADVPVSLVIGRSCVTAEELARLTPGTGLRLQSTPDLCASALWLLLGAHCALAKLEASGALHIIHPFTHEPVLVHQPAGRAIHVKNIPLTLTAEIGQVAISLGELQLLQPGDVIKNIATLDACVQLKVNGYTVAWGQLMQAENGWLVRISHRPDVRDAAAEGERE